MIFAQWTANSHLFPVIPSSRAWRAHFYLSKTFLKQKQKLGHFLFFTNQGTAHHVIVLIILANGFWHFLLFWAAQECSAFSNLRSSVSTQSPYDALYTLGTHEGKAAPVFIHIVWCTPLTGRKLCFRQRYTFIDSNTLQISPKKFRDSWSPTLQSQVQNPRSPIRFSGFESQVHLRYAVDPGKLLTSLGFPFYL